MFPFLLKSDSSLSMRDFDGSGPVLTGTDGVFDDGVGELVRFLKEKGEFDNTLFVYVNDNGWEQEPYQEFRSDSLRWHNGGVCVLVFSHEDVWESVAIPALV